MWVWVEPLIGWLGILVGSVVVAVGVMFGKRIAQWLARTMADAIIEALADQLEPRWRSAIDEIVEQHVSPIKLELQDNDGHSLKDRVSKVQLAVHEMQRVLEMPAREIEERRQ